MRGAPERVPCGLFGGTVCYNHAGAQTAKGAQRCNAVRRVFLSQKTALLKVEIRHKLTIRAEPPYMRQAQTVIW